MYLMEILDINYLQALSIRQKHIILRMHLHTLTDIYRK